MKETKTYCDICKNEITYKNDSEFHYNEKGKKEEYTITNFKVKGFVSVPSVSEPYAWEKLEDICRDCVIKIVNGNNDVEPPPSACKENK